MNKIEIHGDHALLLYQQFVREKHQRRHKSIRGGVVPVDLLVDLQVLESSIVFLYNFFIAVYVA